jgi:hypothetical protein
MERVAVSSSNIASVGYDAGTSTLEIEFNSGGVYEYYDVPEYVYDELMNSGSLGSYHHQNIKNVFSCSQV